MKDKGIAIIVSAALLGAIVGFFIVAWVLMLVWGDIAPLFHIITLSYWQTVVLQAGLSLIGGAFRR